MPTAQGSFRWNDTMLRRTPQTALRLSAPEVQKLAQVLCAWRHVRSAIRATAIGNQGVLAALSRDASWLEKGTHAHGEASTSTPTRTLKLKTGGFVRGSVRHPGTSARPFIRPAGARWPTVLRATMARTFPKPVP